MTLCPRREISGDAPSLDSTAASHVPFTPAQIGCSFRNEICLSDSLLRAHEFTEIEPRIPLDDERTWPCWICLP